METGLGGPVSLLAMLAHEKEYCISVLLAVKTNNGPPYKKKIKKHRCFISPRAHLLIFSRAAKILKQTTQPACQQEDQAGSEIETETVTSLTVVHN